MGMIISDVTRSMGNTIAVANAKLSEGLELSIREMT